MKIAKILPLLKKGYFSLPDNYRPISVLTSLSKIFEKLIHKRMTKFLAKHKLLTPKHSVSEKIFLVHMQLLKSLIL